jgi:hypothetical protein
VGVAVRVRLGRGVFVAVGKGVRVEVKVGDGACVGEAVGTGVKAFVAVAVGDGSIVGIAVARLQAESSIHRATVQARIGLEKFIFTSQVLFSEIIARSDCRQLWITSQTGDM